MRSSQLFDNVQPVLHAKVPIIRSRHRKSGIDIDISLHNTLVRKFDVHRRQFLFYFRFLGDRKYETFEMLH